MRIDTRFNDRLAIALLGGKEASIDAYRRTAASRRSYRLELAAEDRAKAEFKARYERELEDMLQRATPARQPRIRML